MLAELSFIIFNKQLLSAYNVPAPVLGARANAENRIPELVELLFYLGRPKHIGKYLACQVVMEAMEKKKAR